MSEQDRSRIYAWLREQLDERRAEYMMSCLAPAPLSDLVTRDFLTAELSRFATKEDLAAVDAKVAAVDEKVAAVDAKVAAVDAKVVAVDAKVDVLVAQRDDDRAASRVRHFWLAGIGLSALVSIWLDAAGVIG